MSINKNSPDSLHLLALAMADFAICIDAGASQLDRICTGPTLPLARIPIPPSDPRALPTLFLSSHPHSHPLIPLYPHVHCRIPAAIPITSTIPAFPFPPAPFSSPSPSPFPSPSLPLLVDSHARSDPGLHSPLHTAPSQPSNTMGTPGLHSYHSLKSHSKSSSSGFPTGYLSLDVPWM